jgi:uncharacterized protein YuzE
MIKPLLEYDEAAGAAYISFSDAEWDHRVRLDDARGINYGADGSVVGVELLSPRRKGVLLDVCEPTPLASAGRSARAAA